MPQKAIASLSALLVLVVGLAVWGPQVRHSEPWQEAARPYRFGLIRWEAENLLDKWAHRLGNPFARRPGPSAERALVEEYFGIAQKVSSLEAEQERHPPQRRVELGPELAELRRQEKKLRNQVEEILESQISEVLREEGLFPPYLPEGLVFPPVDFHLDRLPLLLIVSPRQKIELRGTLLLRSGMDPEEVEGLEARAEGQDTSSLVEAIGGLATYPTLIPPRYSLEWAVDTAAHEWFHTYLFFRPLGWNYRASYEMTTVNETVADLAGREIGDRVLERFYGIKRQRQEELPPPPKAEPLTFDFNREMRELRQAVDALLAQGKVEEAERLMQEKRDYLESQGYFIRRLNQAYFAFHGTYADQPTSVSPIGGQLRELRRRSISLDQFIKTVSGISRYDQLEKLLSGEEG